MAAPYPSLSLLRIPYAFSRLSFKTIPLLRALVCFRVWITSWQTIMLSKMCLPGMNEAWLGDMISFQSPFNLLTAIFVASLTHALHNLIGLKLLIDPEVSCLGMSTSRDSLAPVGTSPISNIPFTNPNRAGAVKSHVFWKKMTWYPSGPDAFKGLISFSVAPHFFQGILLLQLPSLLLTQRREFSMNESPLPRTRLRTEQLRVVLHRHFHQFVLVCYLLTLIILEGLDHVSFLLTSVVV